MRRVSEGADAAAAADTVLRLAVLLHAGLAPARAWEHLAEAGDRSASRVVAAVAAGASLPDAVAAATAEADAASGWREIAAAWRIATIVGAPLAESLRAVATALRDAREAADDVRVSLAEPAATARLMAWLPLVGVGLAATMGFDVVGSLLGGPLGIGCLVAGGVLILLARRWTAALVRQAAAAPGIPGHAAELLAVALSGGVSIDRARVLVTEAGTPRDAAADRALELSGRAGVPAVELLRASADLARHRARIDGRLRAARLSTRLLLPLGVCTLPAFLFLGVAPMMLSVMSAMPSSW
ncbi:type II secretion system F family protein [Microbacterium sp. NPDC057407]|uniref:type II secretion system F family protein n=1 Tax=Microbacterium sp. NPDC057407 TaxID=3346120 RepID=UPI003671FB58